MPAILRLYGEIAARAARRALRSWPVALSPLVYGAIVAAVIWYGSMLGPIATMIVLSIVGAGCLSSYLTLIAHAVGGGRIRVQDVSASFALRFWDAVSVLFAFFVINFAITRVLAPAAGPKAPIVIALAGLAMAVFFNPVPELLYQSRARSFYLLAESARFVSTKGLEWLFPNIVLAAALLAPLGLLHGPAGAVVQNIAGVFGTGAVVVLGGAIRRLPLWLAPLVLAFVHWAMIFRGLLFQALQAGGGSGRRRAVRDIWGR